MTYMTKDQLRQHLLNAPSGTTPGGIVAALRRQGVQMEGDPASVNQDRSNPFNSFEKGETTISQRMQDAIPKEDSILGKRGQNTSNLMQNIQEQQGGNLSVKNIPELALNLAGNTVGAGLDLLGEVISPLISPVIKSVQQSPGLLGPLAQKTSDAIAPVAEKYENFSKENPRKASAINSAATIASVLPIEKAVPIAVDTAKTLATGVKTGAETAIDVAKTGAKYLPEIKNDAVAQRLMKSALDLNANQIRNISRENVAGGDVFKWLRERGIIGDRPTTIAELEKLSKAAKETVDTTLKNVGGKYALKQSDQALDEVLKQVAPDGVPRAGLESMANEAALLNALPEKTLAQHNKVKRLMDDVLGMFGKTGEGTDNIKAQGWRNLRENVKTFIEDTASSKGYKDIKRLNKDTQVSKAILNALQQTGGKDAWTRLVPLLQKTGGIGASFIAGNVVAGPFGGLAASALARIFSSPKVQSFFARQLANYGESEVNAVLKLLKDGKGGATAKKVINEIVDDLDNVLRLPNEKQQMFIPGS